MLTRAESNDVRIFQVDIGCLGVQVRVAAGAVPITYRVKLTIALMLNMALHTRRGLVRFAAVHELGRVSRTVMAF